MLRSLRACAGDVVLGAVDGCCSITGLIFGVSASGDRQAILLAGIAGASAAAVSMMGGVFMGAETDAATGGAGAPPAQRAAWMLVSDFFAAAVPIAPFAVAPVAEARWISGAMTLALLLGLGFWRGILARSNPLIAALQTASIGAACALAGVAAAHII